MTAPEEIEAWLSAEGRKKEWLAKQLGVHRTTLSQWLGGTYRPEETKRLKIQEICGVAPDAWGRI